MTGIADVVTNPGETIKSTVEAIRHPDQTFHAIKMAISESYERDVINGDAYSRANWFSYAVGTVATSVVGTKGLGVVGKKGVATTKSAAQTGISVTKNAIESSSIANLLPYAPRTQLAMAGDVPFNALNGVELKNQLISMAKVESVGKGAVEPTKEAKESVSGKGISKSEINTAESIKKSINKNSYSVDEFAQLLHPDRVLSDSEMLLVNSLRKEIGLPSVGTIMSKTIPQSDIYKYLYNQYDGVRGFTAVEEHGTNLKTLLEKYNGARLDYNNTAFKTTSGIDGISQSVGLPDKFYGTIEYKVNDIDKLSIPDWKPKVDDYPYTGKGFTGSTDIVLPEYFQSERKFMDGDIIKIIDANTGEIVQQLIYDMDTDIKWIMIGGK